MTNGEGVGPHLSGCRYISKVDLYILSEPMQITGSISILVGKDCLTICEVAPKQGNTRGIE